MVGSLTKSAKPSYLESIECSNKVSRLSDETDRLLTQHQRIDSECARSLRYYRSMISHVDKSIAALESRNHDHDSNAQLSKEYESRYTAMMCSKTYEAFYNDDQKARVEVLEICMGRKTVGPSSFLGHRAQVDKSGDCPQAESMQRRVDTLRASLSTKAAECRANKMKLKTELHEKRATEDKLEDEYYSHHSNKAELKSAAANKVEGRFCSVIQANYKLREENIKKFWVDSCAA